MDAREAPHRAHHASRRARVKSQGLMRELRGEVEALVAAHRPAGARSRTRQRRKSPAPALPPARPRGAGADRHGRAHLPHVHAGRAARGDVERRHAPARRPGLQRARAGGNARRVRRARRGVQPDGGAKCSRSIPRSSSASRKRRWISTRRTASSARFTMSRRCSTGVRPSKTPAATCFASSSTCWARRRARCASSSLVHASSTCISTKGSPTNSCAPSSA